MPPRARCCGSSRSGRPALSRNRPAADITAQVGGALRAEAGDGLELPLQQDLIVVVRSAPIIAEGATGAVVVLHDITDLRRAIAFAGTSSPTSRTSCERR